MFVTKHFASRMPPGFIRAVCSDSICSPRQALAGFVCSSFALSLAQMALICGVVPISLGGLCQAGEACFCKQVQTLEPRCRDGAQHPMESAFCVVPTKIGTGFDTVARRKANPKAFCGFCFQLMGRGMEAMNIVAKQAIFLSVPALHVPSDLDPH